MRQLFAAGLMCAGAALPALAATNTEDFAPEMKAYVSFGFGAPVANDLGLHYGFRMDYDRRYQEAIGRTLPAMVQVNFTQKGGFNAMSLNGSPFLQRTVILNQDGEASTQPVGEEGMFSSFTVLDWSLLAVGAIGVGYAIVEVTTEEDTQTVSAGANDADDGFLGGNPLGGLGGLGGLLGGGLPLP